MEGRGEADTGRGVDRFGGGGADHPGRGGADQPRPREAELVAVVATRRAAADVIRATWAEGDAVVVLDPAAPRAAIDALVEQLSPTRIVVDGERHAVSGGVPVPEGAAAVVVTSGTTARPKGVELTYDGIAAIGHGWAAAMGHEADDHWLVCVPLHHVAGLAILARASITGAAVTVRDTFELGDEIGRAHV